MEEPRNKRNRDRAREDHPEGDQEGTPNQNQNQNPDDPKPDEYLQPKEPTIPPSPTAAEWIEHQITHMPYKPWCPICVKNAATNNPHRMAHHSRGVAMFCMDYMFMIQKPNSEDLMYPILVIKEKISNGVWALPVVRKGAYKSKIVKG